MPFSLTWVNKVTTLGPTNLNNMTTAMGKMPYGPDFSANQVPVWNGSAWVAQKIFDAQVDAAAAIAATKLAAVPKASVTNSVALAITSGTFNTLTFDTERFDTDAIHDTVTNNHRLTCKTAGTYVIHGAATWAASSAGGQRRTRILYNGTTVIADLTTPVTASSLDHKQNVTRIWDMAVNDFLELQVFQDTGGSLNVQKSASESPEFSMVRVSA